MPAEKDLPPNGVTDIWVIVHDERAGESWATRERDRHAMSAPCGRARRRRWRRRRNGRRPARPSSISHCPSRPGGRAGGRPQADQAAGDQEVGRAGLSAGGFAAGLSGDVTLTLDLDTEGHVTRWSCPRAPGHGFDEAAVAAARDMEFSPRRGGRQAVGDPDRVRHPLPAQGRPHARGGAPPAPPRTRGRRRAAAEPPALPRRPARVRGRAREQGTREPLAARTSP